MSKTRILLHQTQETVVDFGYSVNILWFYCSQTIICLSNSLALSVFDDGRCRNTSQALSFISTFLLVILRYRRLSLFCMYNRHCYETSFVYSVMLRTRMLSRLILRPLGKENKGGNTVNMNDIVAEHCCTHNVSFMKCGVPIS